MSLIPTRADLIDIDRKRAAELDALRIENARLKAACPHALDGACLDWERKAAADRARAERAEAQADALAGALREVLAADKAWHQAWTEDRATQLVAEKRWDAAEDGATAALDTYDQGRQMPGEGR